MVRLRLRRHALHAAQQIRHVLFFGQHCRAADELRFEAGHSRRNSGSSRFGGVTAIDLGADRRELRRGARRWPAAPACA